MVNRINYKTQTKYEQNKHKSSKWKTEKCISCVCVECVVLYSVIIIIFRKKTAESFYGSSRASTPLQIDDMMLNGAHFAFDHMRSGLRWVGCVCVCCDLNVKSN